MKLNIVNPAAHTFNEQVGISVERANELSDHLDRITNEYYVGAFGIVIVADIFADIAAICNTPEELVYCTINHCNYMMLKHKVILCPTQNKDREKSK